MYFPKEFIFLKHVSTRVTDNTFSFSDAEGKQGSTETCHACDSMEL